MLALILVILLAPSGQSHYEQAESHLNNGNAADALREFEAAGSEVDEPRAETALLRAARIAEDTLSQTQKAKQLYQRVVHQFPGSRSARRARERLSILDSNGASSLSAEARSDDTQIDTWFKAFSRFERDDPSHMVQLYPLLLHSTQQRSAELWIATTMAQQGMHEMALGWFDGANSQQPLEVNSGLQHVRSQLALSQWLEASELLSNLKVNASKPELAWIATIEGQLYRAKKRHDYRIIAWILLSFIFMMALWLRVRRRTSFWPPPTQVLFLAPIAIILGFMSITANPWVAKAIVQILGGSVVLIWLFSDRQKRTLIDELLNLCILLLGLCALTYLAVTHNNLIDAIYETFRQEN